MKKIYAIAGALMLSPLFMTAQSSCTPHMQISNGVENGSFIQASGAQFVANDFTLSQNYASFDLNSITLNLLHQGGIDSISVTIFNDDNAMIGSEVATIPGIVPTSQDSVNNGFGYTLSEVVLDFTAVPLPGDATYWVQAVAYPTDESSNVAWETTTVGQIGYPLMFDNEGSGWMMGDADGVFSVSGDCSLIEGCLQPENIVVTEITSTTADVHWTEIGTPESWTVEYGPEGFTPGNGTVINDNDGTPMASLSDLEVLTSYDVYVTSNCGEGSTSATVGPVTFSTIDFYCQTPVAFSIEPITLVEFAGISNTTTADPGAAPANEYFFDMTAMVEQGATYPITVEGNTAGNFQTSITLFIDLDQNGEFDMNTERFEVGLIENSTGEDGTQATADITIPEDALLGITRMRVLKMYDPDGVYSESACNAIGYGQTEDYSIQIDENTGVDFAQYHFSMGPNPATDYIQISSTAAIQGVSVYNLLGQKLINRTLNQQAPRIDLSGLSNGTYLMEVEINNEKKVYKVVKQ